MYKNIIFPDLDAVPSPGIYLRGGGWRGKVWYHPFPPGPSEVLLGAGKAASRVPPQLLAAIPCWDQVPAGQLIRWPAGTQFLPTALPGKPLLRWGTCWPTDQLAGV